MSDFVHLHVHTEYSLLDGVNRIPDLIEKVKNDGMEAVAMTDHGVMNGYVEFWSKSKDAGLKPILGCEIYVAPGDRRERKEVNGIKYYHLLLLAQNKTGFHNLVKLVSLGHKEGYYYNPRVDRELLKKYSEGIVVTSACLASPIARNIVLERDTEAEDWLKFFKETFPGRFYLELQRNGHEGHDHYDKKYEQQHGMDWADTIKMQVKVNNKLKEYANKFDLPLVATTDAHFLNAEDQHVQKVLFCIQDGITLNDPRARNGYIGTYIATQAEMKTRFADDLEPLYNTVKLAEQIEHYDITFDRVQPHFWNIPKGKTAKGLLSDLTYEGAKRKYKELTPEVTARIEFELELIHEKGYDDYFLVVADLLSWADKQGILTGTRGSVTGSVVAYALDVVKIDPIKWELYFERFLNPERPSPPDIDMDIQDTRRDELIQYTKEKYGEDSVAAICTFGRFQTKAAIRDVARVMGIDIAIADKLSKMVNVVFGKVYGIDKQLDKDPEFRKIIESDPDLLKLADTVRQISGLARNLSIHAAGYLITPDAIINYTPLQKESRGEQFITQVEFTPLEDLGLMKFDFLGLRTLSILSHALEYVHKNKGLELHVDNIPDDDSETYELFSRGETVGIFQFESPPMRRYLQDLKPENQEDLTFMAAAYRPGAMDFIPDYILRKHGLQEVEYLMPELEDILKTTYGFIIYQEQIMRIAVDIAGYTMGAADKLRKAMGKKIMEVMKKEETKFKDGMVANGFKRKVADQLWEFVLPFADYGFNKAHAAAYAVLAYKCAYLKANYPIEFMAALLHSDLNNSERIVVDMKEAQRMGFQILPPDINKSGVYFSVEGEDTIRFGLGAIKNVGNKICEDITAARKKQGDFTSLDDLITKVGADKLSKRVLESLIMAGAMDQYGERNALLAILPAVFDRSRKQQSVTSAGQMSLFGGRKGQVNQDSLATPLPNLEPVAESQKVMWEKDLLGVFLSTHPLEQYTWAGLLSDFYELSQLSELRAGTKVKTLAIVDERRLIRTKADNKPMSFLTLADMTGTSDAVMFSRVHAEYNEKIEEARPYVIEGTLNFRNDTHSVLIDSIMPADDITPPKRISINICSIEDKEILQELKSCFSDDGDVNVDILYGNKSHPKRITRKLSLSPRAIETIKPYLVRG